VATVAAMAQGLALAAVATVGTVAAHQGAVVLALVVLAAQATAQD